MKTVVFDIDGTLADVQWRRHLVESRPKRFDKFHDAMTDDPPRDEIIELCNLYYNAGWEVLIFTGRPESHRQQTTTWLAKHGVQYAQLHMRTMDRQYDPDNEIKQDMLNGLNRKVHVAVDDRQKVVNMWRENGVVCLQCDVGDF